MEAEKMENENRHVFNITWQGVEIEITCCEPDYMSSHREIYGSGMFHLEVRILCPERAPLPITETGYKWIDLQAQANQYQLF